jgi:hypothetical protein
MIRAAVLLALLALRPAGVQGATGSVAGSATDAGGGRLPGVTITATADGQTRTVTTDSNGQFKVQDLRPGRYRFTARLSGFVQASFDDVVVEAEKTATLSFVLRMVAPQDPVIEFRSTVAQYVGDKPVDCGQFPLTRGRGELESAAASELQEAIACGGRATKASRPFLTFTRGWGIDSWIAHGLLGTAEGAVYRFSFDSAPCGGPGCAARFEIVRCLQPSVTTGRRPGFSCGVLPAPFSPYFKRLSS